MGTLKKLAIAALLLWAGSALLYQALLTDYEDRRLVPREGVTETFPGSAIFISLYTEGGRVEERGTLVWGGTYSLGIHVESKSPIQGRARLNGFTIVETATGKVLHRSDQSVEAEFQPDASTHGSLAYIRGPEMQLPFTDCTVRADLSLQTPWGEQNETVAIPFARKVRTFRAVPFLLVLGGV